MKQDIAEKEHCAWVKVLILTHLLLIQTLPSFYLGSAPLDTASQGWECSGSPQYGDNPERIHYKSKYVLQWQVHDEEFETPPTRLLCHFEK